MIALTGGTGFLGDSLLNALSNKSVRCLGRRNSSRTPNSLFYKCEINETADFSVALRDTNILIHCAARVHIKNDGSLDSLQKFREINTYGTLNLAQQAANAGLKRFIFISSIKVNGESTVLNFPFRFDDNCIPFEPYAKSKYEAELGLWGIAKETDMEVVIIRPPLVYGPNVKANFAALMNLVNRGLPLPFGSANSNKRSMVYVGNLVDLIVNCIDNPKAAGQTFMVSDDNDLSTRELITYMGNALGKNTLQLPFPVSGYRLLGKLTGKSDVVDRLVSSLQVDIQHTKDTLNWEPPFTVEQGMLATAKEFLKEKKK